MDVQDLRTLREGCVIRADVCIVGSGPAGLTLARELSSLDEKVVVVESGGRELDPWTDGLNAIENVGVERVVDQTRLRNRVFGGTSTTWSGRVATFSDIDFEERPWVPDSGWPFARSELKPYFERSLPYLGIAIADNANQPPEAFSGGCASGVDPRYLIDYVWSYSRDTVNPRDFARFGPRALTGRFNGVRAFVNATVTHIDTTPEGDLVTGLEVTGADALRRRVEARYTILAAGGIENARLLLASNRQLPGGVGNSADVVGRYLADHPRGPVGYFAEPGYREIQRRFGNQYAVVNDRQVTLTVGLALSPHVQRTEELLNCSMWVSGVLAIDDPLGSLSRLTRMRGGTRADVAHVVRGAGLIGAGAKRYLIDRRSPLRRLQDLSLEAMVEQQPDRNSRVTLSSQVDALGIPLSKLDWRINTMEARTVRRAAQLFASEMTRLGAPRPIFAEMMIDHSLPLKLPDVAHPSGTTRMSSVPRTGVVDEKCAVHGVEGLFIAGSSTFPTNSHANPTQMIVAMAIRLADEVKRRLAIDRTASTTTSALSLDLL